MHNLMSLFLTWAITKFEMVIIYFRYFINPGDASTGSVFGYRHGTAEEAATLGFTIIETERRPLSARSLFNGASKFHCLGVHRHEPDRHYVCASVFMHVRVWRVCVCLP